MVIGYGSPVRGDDAVGGVVAETVATWGLPGVHTLAVHQLTPELAEPLAAAELAIFVDAAPTTDADPVARTVSVSEISPADTGVATVAWGHFSDPAGLLALARLIYGRCPQAHLVAIPATDFGLTPEVRLSPTTLRAIGGALDAIARLICHGQDR